MINRSLVSLMSSMYMMSSFGPITDPWETLQVSATETDLRLELWKSACVRCDKTGTSRVQGSRCRIVRWVLQQYAVINGVECCAEIHQHQGRNKAGVRGTHDVIVNDCERRLSRVVLPVRWLACWKQTILVHTDVHPVHYQVLNCFGDQAQVRDWFVWLDIKWVERRFVILVRTTACLCESGNKPCVKDAFAMDVIIGASTSHSSLTNHVGIGSCSHCLFSVFVRIWVTSLAVKLLKLTGGTSVCSIVGTGAVAVVALMISTFPVKHDLKSSAVWVMD